MEAQKRKYSGITRNAAVSAEKLNLARQMRKLPTKAEVRADIQAAIAPLATKADVSAEIQAEGVRTRRHFDVVAEGLHADIRMVAEGVVALQARGDAHYTEIKGILVQHDRRLMRLEASPSKRG